MTRTDQAKKALDVVARGLSELAALGSSVKVKGGVVFSDFGLVLDNPDGSWSPRYFGGEPPEWWNDHDQKSPDDT